VSLKERKARMTTSTKEVPGEMAKKPTRKPKPKSKPKGKRKEKK